MISEAITYIDPFDRETWIQVGMALRDELGDDGFDIWDAWSSQAANYDPKCMATQWRSFRGTGITIRSLYYLAKQNGWEGQGEAPRNDTPRRHYEWEREEAVRHERARRVAMRAIGDASYETHPYLARKGFPDEKGLVLRGMLLIPMRDMRTMQQVNSAQYIDADGTKKFLPGGKAKGSVFPIGRGPETYLCEGYATGLSVRDALASLYQKARVVVCFSAANVAYVAQSVGDYVIADHDASKTGEKYAEKTGLPWWMPPSIGDANDFHQSESIRALAEEIRRMRSGGRFRAA